MYVTLTHNVTTKKFYDNDDDDDDENCIIFSVA